MSSATFVEMKSYTSRAQFELEIRGQAAAYPGLLRRSAAMFFARDFGDGVIPAAVRIFASTEFIDLRQGFDRLAHIVKVKLGEDPHAGSIFVFANRSATRLKALWFDGNGYRLLYKSGFTVPCSNCFLQSVACPCSSNGLRPVSRNTAPFPGGSFFVHTGPEGQVAASHWAARSAGLFGDSPALLRGTMSPELFNAMVSQGLIQTGDVPGLPFFPPQTVILPEGLGAANGGIQWSIAPLTF